MSLGVENIVSKQFLVFVDYFLSVIKDKAFWYITRRIFCANLENRIFLPHFTVLPVFIKYGTAHKRAVGEKNDFVFGFRMKNFISRIAVFRILRPKLNFTVKFIIFFKSQNIEDFLTSNYDIPRIIGMIFFTNCS